MNANGVKLAGTLGNTTERLKQNPLLVAIKQQSQLNNKFTILEQ